MQKLTPSPNGEALRSAAMTDEKTPAVEQPTTEEARPGGFPWGVFVSLALAVLLVVFAVQNTQPVELRFLWWVGEFPLVVIIVAVAITAIVLTSIIAVVLRRRRRRRAEERAELDRLRRSQ